MSWIRSVLPSALIIIAAIVIDQAIKLIVEMEMGYGQQIELLPFLSLYRTHNEGIAFSMLSGISDKGLVIMTFLVMLVVLYLWWSTPKNRVFARLGFALIIGGAAGNLIDRALLGYVVDYIYFHTPVWSFAVFNMADIFITCGAGLIILEELLGWKRDRKAQL